MALGAQPSRVVAMMLKKIALPVGLGLIAGAGLSYWASRYVGSLLYNIDARDPVTFASAAAFLAIVSLVAAWVPARRAAGIDPARVLHEG
jgi:ABC-type antimicrobial peptide transport system permease subunit